MESSEQGLTIREIPSLNPEYVERAAKSIVILPHGWEGEEAASPSYVDSALSLEKLLAENDIPVEPLTPFSAETLTVESRSQTWIGPTLLLSAALLVEYPHLAGLIMRIITDYVEKIAAGMTKSPRASLRIVQVSDPVSTARMIDYEGPVSGLADVAEVVSRFGDSEERADG